ncbi:hypothetical protein AB9P05_15140 [Roseivirga sp. BDSF3-8]
MKASILLVGLFIFGLSACSQRTCPTYTKDDVQKKEIIETEKV